MKRIALIFITLILIFSFTSCINVTSTFKLSQDRSFVKLVEFYYVDEMLYTESNVHCFLEENTPVKILKDSKCDKLLDALCKTKFEKEVILFPIPMDGGVDVGGYVVSVVYSDGGYDLVSATGSYSYSIGKDGKERHKYDYSDYCGEAQWDDIVKPFL